jgi:alkylhydroperoxidase family enzyme
MSSKRSCVTSADQRPRLLHRHGRESRLYSDRERAALAVCEAMTLISDGHVPDEVWEPARAAFTAEELATLVSAITAINAWNRLMITTRFQPGHYEPGLFEAA